MYSNTTTPVRNGTKALLVYPEFPDTYWSFRHALSFVGKRSAFPPLGLMTISAMLPPNWTRRLVDLNVRPLRRSDVAWADIVLVSAMLVQRESLDQVVELCNALGKPVAVGGPYVTTNASAAPGADYIFAGESETTIPEFLADLAAGGGSTRTYRAAERPSLAVTPVPQFELADQRFYSAMSVQYSRGCPFQCEFCDIIEIYGRVPRTKSNEQMLAELDALRRTGWRGRVFIVDDNFIGNKKNAKRLLPELAEWSDRNGQPFSFATEASMNLADDDKLLEMMKRANFRRVFLGIETPDEESLREAQKGQNTKRDLVDGVRRIQAAGMEVMAGFIVGFDNDREDIFERQVAFIRESAIPLAMVGLLQALPDTQLWRRLEREGRLLAEGSGNNTDCSINFVPKMETAQLVEGYKSILRTIYSSTEYYQRALDCLARVTEERPEPNTSSALAEIAALVRVVLALGIRDGDRGEFWRYMGKVWSEHRDRFGAAVTLAAMGHHFRKITREYCDDATPFSPRSRVPDGAYGS